MNDCVILREIPTACGRRFGHATLDAPQRLNALSRMKSVNDLWATSAARRNTTSCSGVARSPSRAERVEGDDATAVMATPIVLDQLLRC